MTAKSAEEHLKEKGITELSAFHAYPYLYKATIEAVESKADEQAIEFARWAYQNEWASVTRDEETTPIWYNGDIFLADDQLLARFKDETRKP